jgi:Fur family ferric uptake transcriptional regulator
MAESSPPRAESAPRPAESWRDQVHLTLRQAGLRQAEARERVVALLADEPCALSAVEIEQALRSQGRPTGLASIYRALELLSDHGLVERVAVGPGVTRFERSTPGHEHHHHHLVCEECGRLVAFDDPALERAIHNASKRLGVRVEHHEVLLRGSCEDCD